MDCRDSAAHMAIDRSSERDPLNHSSASEVRCFRQIRQRKWMVCDALVACAVAVLRLHDSLIDNSSRSLIDQQTRDLTPLAEKSMDCTALHHNIETVMDGASDRLEMAAPQTRIDGPAEHS